MYAPLVDLARPVIDTVVDTVGVGAVPTELAVAPRPEVGINLHGRGPQSTRLLQSLEPHRLVAFVVDARWQRGEHEVARWCRLLTESGVPADPADLLLRHPESRADGCGAVVVHPGASTPARRWPPQRFAAVARELVRSGRRVVVTGSANERALALEVGERAGLAERDVVAGRIGIAELAAVVAHAACVVSGDTGVAHLASAFATPSVVLFGRTPPSEWGPPRRSEHVALWHPRVDVRRASTGHPDAALLAITVDEVLHALATLEGQALTHTARP